MPPQVSSPATGRQEHPNGPKLGRSPLADGGRRLGSSMPCATFSGEGSASYPSSSNASRCRCRRCFSPQSQPRSANGGHQDTRLPSGSCQDLLGRWGQAVSALGRVCLQAATELIRLRRQTAGRRRRGGATSRVSRVRPQGADCVHSADPTAGLEPRQPDREDRRLVARSISANKSGDMAWPPGPRTLRT